jgi:hypothetical protein
MSLRFRYKPSVRTRARPIYDQYDATTTNRLVIAAAVAVSRIVPEDSRYSSSHQNMSKPLQLRSQKDAPACSEYMYTSVKELQHTACPKFTKE